ncbi:hypothetical protein ACKKBF_B32030 [Auxenochlorella protothecoides x Auxenochlorella symbiontica]
MSAAALKRRRKREAARKEERGDEAEVPAPPSPHPAEPDLAQGRADPEATPPPSPIAGVPSDHDEASEDAEEEGPRLCGISELPCPAAIPHVPIIEPYISAGLAKDRSSSNEDQWLLKSNNSWGVEGSQERTSFAAYGIFDGHGGRNVATFASNSLLKSVMAAADAASGPGPRGLPSLPDADSLPPGLAAVAALQSLLARRLPQALVDGFEACNADACARFKTGGSTATLAVIVGWHLLVGSVGDSFAVLDTGSEVLTASANHRLEDSEAEAARILASGGEVAPSTVNGRPAGPTRVWPGGLAMSRTLGDAAAGPRVLGTPEVHAAVLPPGGARLILASDGLWDACAPKPAAHAVRGLGAQEAAHRLLAMAVKKDRLKDDVTVVVVDFLPAPGAGACAVPRLGRAEAAARAPACVPVWQPLLRPCHRQAEAAAAACRREVVEAEAAEQEEREAIERRLAEVHSKAEEQAGDGGQESSSSSAETLPDAEDAAVHTPTLHSELLHLRVSPEDLMTAIAGEEAAGEPAPATQEWEVVGERPVRDAPRRDPRRGGPRGRGRGVPRGFVGGDAAAAGAEAGRGEGRAPLGESVPAQRGRGPAGGRGRGRGVGRRSAGSGRAEPAADEAGANGADEARARRARDGAQAQARRLRAGVPRRDGEEAAGGRAADCRRGPARDPEGAGARGRRGGQGRPRPAQRRPRAPDEAGGLSSNAPAEA